jgi:hypothetical protein
MQPFYRSLVALFYLELGRSKEVNYCRFQKTNIPIAALNISRVAIETTTTLGIELGWSFMS